MATLTWPTLAQVRHTFTTHGHKLLVFVLWVGIVGSFWWLLRQNDLTPLALLQQIINFVSESAYGPLIYIGIYLLRPLLLFPSTLLSIAAGYLFGPVLGLILAWIGGNLSAALDYGIGYYFGNGLFKPQRIQSTFQNYLIRLREHSFETVLVMRFLFLPYDSVSLLCGFLRIGYCSFALATFIGGIPGSLTFVLFGASINGDLTSATPSLQPRMLFLAAFLFIVSLGLSRLVRRREYKT